MITTWSRLAVFGLAVQPLAFASEKNQSILSGPFGYSEQIPIVWNYSTLPRIQTELGPSLSNVSSIFGPDDSRWEATTERYSTLGLPDIQVVVQPALESEISTIVSAIIS